MILKILWLLAAVALSSGAIGVGAQEKVSDDDIESIRQMLQIHDQALKAHDLEKILSVYTSEAEPIMLGTGPGERWIGKDEIADAYRHFFSDFDVGAMDSDCTWRQGDIQGDVAWLLAMCQMTDYLKNVERRYALNLSAVLEKEGTDWRFRTLHFSNLTGGGQPAP